MKRILLMAVLAAFFVGVNSSFAASPLKNKVIYKVEMPELGKNEKLSDAEIQKLVARIDEIKSMDLKNLPAKERHDLRKELRDIKNKVDKNADGFSVYLSGGVIIILVVVLLLLLL
jgi:hypothetical protein